MFSTVFLRLRKIYQYYLLEEMFPISDLINADISSLCHQTKRQHNSTISSKELETHIDLETKSLMALF